MVGKKGKFTREVAGKLTVIFKFIENHPKISKYRKRESLPGKWQANLQLSSNLLKIIQKYQSIEVIQLYES